MITTQNSGKYLTRRYEREKNEGELDSSGLTPDQISFLEIQDGMAARYQRITQTQPVDPLTESKLIEGGELIDGVLYLL